MIKMRKATLNDKDRMIQISSQIWNGEDYVPNIFEKWVNDDMGEFTAFEYEGEVKGFAKFTVLSEGRFWLEGIRADSNFRGMGLGDTLTKYYIQKAKNMNYKSLELSSWINNKASLKIVEKNGFKRVAEFKGYSISNPINFDLKDYKVADSLEDVLYILDSEYLKASKGYMPFDWTFIRPTKELLTDLLGSKCIYQLKENNTVLSTIIMSKLHSKADIGFINYIDINKYTEDALKFALSNFKKLNFDSLEFLCPSNDFLKNICKLCDFEAYDESIDNDIFVYIYGH